MNHARGTARSMQKNGTGRGGGECADCGAPEDSPPPQCATRTATKSDYTRKDEQEMFHPTGAWGLECFALPVPLTASLQCSPDNIAGEADCTAE